MPMLGIMASAISGNLFAPAGAYDSISSVTLSASASSITFSGIPATYTHLQLRIIAQSNRATYGSDSAWGKFNSDATASYSYHGLRGDGATASAINGVSQSAFYVYGMSGTNVANAYTFGNSVIDVLDYANTSKYKTLRYLAGVDLNGLVGGYGGPIALGSSLWMNTAAITSINLYPESGTLWNANSSFALYGVK